MTGNDQGANRGKITLIEEMEETETETIDCWDPPGAAEQQDGPFVESEELARFLLESSRDGVVFLDADENVLFLNRTGRDLLGIKHVERYLRKSWLNLLAEGAREIGRGEMARAAEGKLVEFDIYSPAFTGEAKWWRISINPLMGTLGQPYRYYMVLREITAHMLALRALKQSEDGFKKLIEENPIGMVLANLDFQITKANNALCGMLGFSESELLGRDLRNLAAEKRAQLEGINRVLNGGLHSFQQETRFLSKRGRSVWGQVTTSVIRDGEKQPIYLVQMIENVSERKKSEEQLLSYQEQLQSLASELALSEERERRRIATNLHDRIGQTLAFARLKLGTISQGGGAVTSESLAEIRQLIEQSIADTRSLTFELSPPVLYELGLVPALEWLARKIQQEHGIHTRFQDDGQPKPLDDKFRVVLFQAVRELLFNVVKHAQASHAQVLMRRDADALRIVIEDDGKGFDAESLEGDRMRGFGLFNVKERLEYLGGRMKIRSQPGTGTRITLMAPLRLNS